MPYTLAYPLYTKREQMAEGAEELAGSTGAGGRVRRWLTQGPAVGGGAISCCGLNLCVLPKFLCWNPNAQDDGIKRWGL